MQNTATQPTSVTASSPSRRCGAIRLVSTKNMDRHTWLAIRNQGIGSSDSACVLGLSPYKSALELWLEKTRRKPPENLTDKESVFWGTVLEPVIADAYAKKMSATVRRVNAILQHPQHPFMQANLDREVRFADGTTGILEIKTAGWRMAPLWEEGVPEAYQCQVLHQLAVTGKPWADVAVLIGGQDFRVFRIFPDQEKIAALIDVETAFWRCVENQTPPHVDHSDSAGRALAFLYPKEHGEEVDFTEDPRMNALFAKLVQSRKTADEANTNAKLLQHRMQQVIGCAPSARFHNGKISWRRTKDSTTTDLKRLEKDYPDLVKHYTVTRTGYRRFVVTAN